MNDVFIIMLPPLVACLILTGIHTYLGLHVVSRGVIFVDLALAQIAALGSTFAFLLGFDPRSQAGYFYSLGFAFLGAAIFSLTRLKHQRIPQEAIIGITFAVASSAAILIADRAPEGAEHVEEMLTGAILWVSWPTIIKTLAIYAVIGLFHFIFREKLLLISMQPEEAERQGLVVRWWDFLFYVSFGFVITSSVAIAGILLVFSFLIIPSVIGMLFSERIGPRLATGWLSGTLVSLLGLYFSYRFDLPSGPAVVCSFGGFLILAALVQYLIHAESPGRAFVRVLSGVAAVVLLLVLAVQFEPSSQNRVISPETRLQQFQQKFDQLAQDGDVHSLVEEIGQNLEFLRQQLQSESLKVDQKAIQRLAQGGQEAVPISRSIFENSDAPWTQYYAADSLIQLGEKEGIHDLIHLLNSGAPPFLENKVLQQLQSLTGVPLDYDSDWEPETKQQAVDRLEVWWHQNATHLGYDSQTKSFQIR